MRRILFLLIIGLAGLAVLLGLGTWQVQRLGEKRALIAAIDARVGGDPVALPQNPDPARDKYLAVTAEGEMQAGEIHVLVSMKEAGAGYRIIAPFALDDGRRIMVDRGFVPATAKDAPRATGRMRITGNLHWPDEIDGFTPEPDLRANIWFARDVPAMAARLGTDPVLVVARESTGPAIRPLPVDSSAIPDNHLNYAITWFSLAIVWSAMSAYFLWRTRAKSESKKT